MEDIYLKKNYVTDEEAKKALREMGYTPVGDCIVDREIDGKDATFYSGYWWVGKGENNEWVHAHFDKYERG